MNAMLTVKQAAQKIGVSESLVYGWIADGQLAHFRLGAKGHRGAIRIQEEDMEAFLATCRQGEQVQTTTTPRAQVATLKHLRLKSS